MPTESAAGAGMTELAGWLAPAALACAGLLLAPLLLPLHRVAPRAAARVWMLALCLRAVVALAAVAATSIWLPSTAGFQLLAGRTWHRIVPLVPDDVDLSLDPLAHAAVLLPAGAMALSVLGFGLVRLRVRARIQEQVRINGLGEGPEGSLVMADRDIYVALTGLGPRRVLVSAGALAGMDEAELRACLAHEQGHRRLSHRGWALAAAALRSVSRLVPGSRACERGLGLSLERQADEYAVQRTGDPLALASGICKAAAAKVPQGALGVAGSGLSIRLEQLLGGQDSRSSAQVERAVNVLALMLAGAVLALAVASVAAASQAGGFGLAVACSF